MIIQRFLLKILLWILSPIFNPPMHFFVFPGGKMPERQTDGAIGYDAFGRAIVHPQEKDPANPILRRTIFNFKDMPNDPEVRKKIHTNESGELVYRMDPGESILVGIGFATWMLFPFFYWVAPRSGLASVKGITVTNAPGTVDPDYRGEAGVLVYNRNNHPFDISGNMRICQIIFCLAFIPRMFTVRNHSDLGSTARAEGGFGHTGFSGSHGGAAKDRVRENKK